MPAQCRKRQGWLHFRTETRHRTHARGLTLNVEWGEADSSSMNTNAFTDPLKQVAHRPWSLPTGTWRLRQRWKNLLFAHWPVPAAHVAASLPAGLEPDLFDGHAWLGVVPFSMDHVHTRMLGQSTATVPSTTAFHELNLRTYVRSRRTGRAGVFFYSLDCTSPLAVLGARTLFHLPYFLAAIRVTAQDGGIDYRSRRRLVLPAPVFEASYRPVGLPLAPAMPGSLEHFFTERYALFTTSFGKLLAGDIHHLPWPLQAAEAEIRRNELPAAHGFTLPSVAPILHFSRELYVNLWGLHREP